MPYGSISILLYFGMSMKFLKGESIFDGNTILNNMVLVLDDKGKFEEIIAEDRVDSLKVQTFEGILCPGLINAHCHLELSNVFQKIPQHTGIVDFVLQLQAVRNSETEHIQDAIQAANESMFKQGIVAVADISNGIDSALVKSQSSIRYHTFIELLGLNPSTLPIVLEKGKNIAATYERLNLPYSFAPHAPYSSSEALIQHIFNSERISSIHFMESMAELEFMQKKEGDFLRLYEHFGIGIDFFEPIPDNLESFIQKIAKKHKTLLVHNTFSNPSFDFQDNFVHCFCPKANLFIENTLPQKEFIQKNAHKALIGTDSLASNTSLNLIEELFALQDHAQIPLGELLKMATQNAAEFFEWNDLGGFTKGKSPGVCLIKETNNEKLSSKSYSEKIY
jgi:aminodeoxyfutalosine deaminase